MFRNQLIRLRIKGPHRRQLHVHTHTLFAPSARDVTNHLKSCQLKPESVILYLLHPELQDISSIVTSLQQSTHSSIGSIALAPPKSSDTPTVSIATFTPTKPREKVTIFRSDLVGRPDAQVGKWQRDPMLRDTMTTADGKKTKRQEDRKGEEVGEMERVMLGLGVSGGSGHSAGSGTDHTVMGWDALWRSGRDVAEHDVDQTPQELKDIPRRSINSMILLADGTPDALLRMLNQRYFDVQKLGFVTYPTPFLTNRPFTLFHNTTIFDHGALGLAFSGVDQPFEGGVEYEGLEPLGGIEEIAQAQGNLLLRLSPSPTSPLSITNPTQALIKAINTFRASLAGESVEALRPAQAMTAAKGISIGKGMKEEEYYLGLFSRDSTVPYQVVKIMSGDPSRGAISLEMEEPLLTGQRVQVRIGILIEETYLIPRGFIQFMHKPRAAETGSPASSLKLNEISFFTLPQEEYTNTAGPQETPKEATRPGFAVGSEGGFFFADTAKQRANRVVSGVCKVTNARGYLRFPSAAST
ncbi:hypothetical protein QFC22_001306 [Naganishia vaughanmartiniae]|uniref:Uncharacterized protein n=1 Tax=Naganishia vaughanmartiniae TaxID=1424756 RepID=A0ACC2XGG3_9TREE|nr:hypothetical protein QFC22_001306 [Naganishia vaughanmartiniae]